MHFAKTASALAAVFALVATGSPIADMSPLSTTHHENGIASTNGFRIGDVGNVMIAKNGANGIEARAAIDSFTHDASGPSAQGNHILARDATHSVTHEAFPPSTPVSRFRLRPRVLETIAESEYIPDEKVQTYEEYVEGRKQHYQQVKASGLPTERTAEQLESLAKHGITGYTEAGKQEKVFKQFKAIPHASSSRPHNSRSRPHGSRSKHVSHPQPHAVLTAIHGSGSRPHASRPKPQAAVTAFHASGSRSHAPRPTPHASTSGSRPHASGSKPTRPARNRNHPSGVAAKGKKPML